MPPSLADLRTIDEVAQATGLDRVRLEEYASAKLQVAYYQTIAIPKRGRRRGGQYRLVHKSQSDWLRQFHHEIARLLAAAVTFPDCVQGFVQRRSAVSNARLHLNSPVVRHADLEDFFDTITMGQVQDVFVSLGCTAPIASLLARATTIDGFLRQGTRCSPTLANCVCRGLDKVLGALAQTSQARYSRYADNLTFSGETVPDLAQIRVAVTNAGFRLRDQGCYTQYKGRCQYVTGLTVGHSDQPRLPKRMKRNLRLVLHYIEALGSEAHFERVGQHSTYKNSRAVCGAIRFCYSVEPRFVARLVRLFPKASNEVGWSRDVPKIKLLDLSSLSELLSKKRPS